MKITVVGTGYVGLVTGVCLAYKGHHVICIDKKKDIVEKINNMEVPIYEPGLDKLLKEVIASGRLKAATELGKSVAESEVSIIAVGTPFKGDEIDLTYIKAATKEIGTALKERDKYHVVCVKSTVIPTTTDTLVKNYLEDSSGKKLGEDIGLAMNPEFLREGKAMEDFMNPDRIVIGAYDKNSFSIMEKVYKDYFKAPIIRCNLRTAEMIKYTANALLATLISYSNEVATICEKTGEIDVKEVLEGVVLDKRFNPRVNGKLVNPEMNKYLQAGCGFGGSCFPKDVKALISYSIAKEHIPRIIDSTIEVNKEQPLRIISRLEDSVGTLEGKKVAVLGLAFKPETDDVRESPSIAIIKELLEKKARVHGVDPKAMDNMKKIIPPDNSLTYSTEYKSALEDADAVILVTSWPDFVQIPPEDFIRLMKKPLVVDGRRVFDKARLKAKGIRYIGVGLAY
ncbi:UDP-glucose/GDP-mannose dehydrogenase family protein [Proteinivorax hydrogeniformans]|uniref:UDP-glucose 6-dehydrogenase n=1 Tax=Proteinivorax hydrogeniformans TaxID=1826727 RepID=A0AAU8HV22_9FIRM